MGCSGQLSSKAFGSKGLGVAITTIASMIAVIGTLAGGAVILVALLGD
jgi:hypothetical protein